MAAALSRRYVYFGQTEQEGLAAAFGGAAAAVDADVERLFDRGQNVFVEPFRVPQRLDHFAVDDIAGAYRFGGIGDVVDGVVVVGHAPVALETLGGDAGADSAAEGHAFGQAAVIAVEEGGGVGVEAMNLQET